MSYPLHTKAIICYIEAHIKDTKINYGEMEKRIGFSLAHIRDLFRQDTGYSLAKYIRMRKVKCSAIELINTDKSILEIAYTYGFSNPETYTRVFQKQVGMTPSAFRIQKPIVGKEELAAGVYGIGILKEGERKEGRCHKHSEKKIESTILYGVPRVVHGAYGAWKKALEAERAGMTEENYSCLLEKLLCQIDAMACLTDGRRCAAAFFEEQAKVSPAYGKEYKRIAGTFTECVRAVEEMWTLYGNTADMDGMLKAFADPEIREKTCALIDRAYRADTEALALMKRVILLLKI